MNIRINRNCIVQYCLIYLMLIIPGSCLFQVYLPNYKYNIILGIYLLIYIFNPKYRKNYGVLISLILFLIVIFIRFAIGGVGLQVWMHFSICVLSVQFAIKCNKNKFLNRFIKAVVFFTLISLVIWAMLIIYPNLYNLLGTRYYVQTIGEGSWAKTYYGRGLLLYSYLDIHRGRNCGIYTEPGVFQIVLNSALLILLFWRNKLELRNTKQYITYFVIVLLGIITCQSTTGYISLLLIVIFYAFIYRDFGPRSKKIRYTIFFFLLSGIVFFGCNYSIMGENSIIYQQVIGKIFNASGKLDLTSGSGQYRLGMIIYSFSSIMTHPFGVGYDIFNIGINNGDVAAALVSFAAVFGIIPWCIVMFLIFYPVVKYETKMFLFLFFLCYINTTLAQTDLLYPSLLLFPLYLIENRQ